MGIDNLVFIAILVKNCPPAGQGAIIGLSLALLIRLGLLSVMSWLVTLNTTPILHLGSPFSGRDLILMGEACSTAVQGHVRAARAAEAKAGGSRARLALCRVLGW